MNVIAVIGGGIIGRACALHLARAGRRVVLYDTPPKDNSSNGVPPSWCNAGHIAIEQVAPLASPATVLGAPKRLMRSGGGLSLPIGQWPHWFPFAFRLLANSTPRRFNSGKAALGSLMDGAMPAWRRLASSVDHSQLLVENGHIVVWESDASARKGASQWARADTGGTTHASLLADELATLRAISPSIAGGIRFAGTGQIRSLDALRECLALAMASAGVEIRDECVGLTEGDGQVLVSDESYSDIVLAPGIGAPALLKGLGIRVPMIAERGYHIRAFTHDWPEHVGPVVFEDRAMIVTRFDDVVQASSFVEFSSPSAPPDPAKWERLEAHVRELGLPLSGPFTRWFGPRPTLPDYLPVIGRLRSHPQVVCAFGHQHLGLTLAPVTAELVCAIIQGHDPAVNLAPFRFERFC